MVGDIAVAGGKLEDAVPGRTSASNPSGVNGGTYETAGEDHDVSEPLEEGRPTSSSADGRLVRYRGAPAPRGEGAPSVEVAADELIVTYRAGASEAGVADLRARYGLTVEDRWPALGAELVALPEAVGTGEELLEAEEGLESDPVVLHAEPNQIGELAWSPNDQVYAQGYQNNLRVVGVVRAWSISKGSGARIAVLDTGCYRAHVELDGGKIVAQRDFVGDDPVANDVVGHGTYVSSIVAAHTDNRAAIAAVAPNARIICAKVAADDGTVRLSHVVDGLQWLDDTKAAARPDVVNMSFTYPRSSPALHNAVRRLHDYRGVTLVAATGNRNTTARAFPAYYADVIAVSGTAKDGTGPYPNANTGDYVDVAAPAMGIWGATTDSQSSAAPYDGTSGATPQVSGAAALLAARGRGVAYIDRALRQTADDRGANGRDDVYGHGLLDTDGALGY